MDLVVGGTGQDPGPDPRDTGGLGYGGESDGKEGKEMTPRVIGRVGSLSRDILSGRGVKTPRPDKDLERTPTIPIPVTGGRDEKRSYFVFIILNSTDV